MLFKIIVIALLLTILISLGTALYYLITGKGQSLNMVKALSVRIGISVALFLLLIFAFWMGWIKPHGL